MADDKGIQYGNCRTVGMHRRAGATEYVARPTSIAKWADGTCSCQEAKRSVLVASRALLAKDDPSERGRVISDRAAEATKSCARGRFSESYWIEQVHCACFEFRFRTVCAVAHRTSQMLRTMGLLPVWTGLRGSTVAFSGVHCRGGGSSHAVWPFRPSLIVSLEDTGLVSSPEDWSSK